MKILYAIQGTGNGHISRAIEIIPYLKEKAEVDLLISGYQSELTLPFEVKYRLYGLSFIFGKKGGIAIWKTIKNIKVIRLWREIQSLPIKNYDLIINDFEPISAWACILNNGSILSLSHQNGVIDKKSPKKMSKLFKIEHLILKYYAPAKIKFGFHFKTYSSSTFLPIIRKEIRNKPVSFKNHYTVYLPAYGDRKLIHLLSKIKHVKWEVFSKQSKNYQLHANVRIQPINQKNFIKSIVSSQGVLCGAGFETPAEALFLNKKLMVIPMKNQYEQQCNALALKEMGVPVLKKLSIKQLQKVEKWVNSNQNVKVNYPDSTENIINSILAPFYERKANKTFAH